MFEFILWFGRTKVKQKGPGMTGLAQSGSSEAGRSGAAVPTLTDAGITCAGHKDFHHFRRAWSDEMMLLSSLFKDLEKQPPGVGGHGLPS
jgi:hypothetical protein